MAGIRIIHQDALTVDTLGKVTTLEKSFFQRLPTNVIYLNRSDLKDGQTVINALENFQQNRLPYEAMKLSNYLNWRDRSNESRSLLHVLCKHDPARFGFLQNVENPDGLIPSRFYSYNDFHRQVEAMQPEYIAAFKQNYADEIALKKAEFWAAEKGPHPEMVDEYLTKTTTKDREAVTQKFLQDWFAGYMQNRDQNVADILALARETEVETISIKTAKFIDKLQRGAWSIAFPEDNLLADYNRTVAQLPEFVIGATLMGLTYGIIAAPAIFAPIAALVVATTAIGQLYSPWVNDFKHSLVQNPPIVDNPQAIENQLLAKLKLFPETKTILEDAGVDIFVADDEDYLHKENPLGGIYKGYSNFYRRNIFVRTNMIEDTGLLREETTHYLASRLNKFDRSAAFREAAFEDLANPQTKAFLQRFGNAHKFDTYERRMQPPEVLAEIEFIKEEKLMKSRGLTSQEADAVLSQAFPRTFPFYQDFLAIRSAVAAEIVAERTKKEATIDNAVPQAYIEEVLAQYIEQIRDNSRQFAA